MQLALIGFGLSLLSLYRYRGNLTPTLSQNRT
jgi:hypothetical protein